MTRWMVRCVLIGCLMGLGLPSCAAAATLFGLVDTGELYASTNGGVSWTVRSTLPVSDAIGLAARSSALDLYLATRTGSIFHSTDGGTTWAATGSVAASDVSGFALGPFGAVLALTRTGTLYASEDEGTTFTARSALTGSNWVSLTRGPLGTLYALTQTGEVVRSADQGVTWVVAGRVTVSNAVALRRLGSQLHLLTETGEVYRSVDLGVTWTAVAALTASGMSALAELGESQLVAAARTGEVAASGSGSAWTWIGTINQLHVVALGADTPQATGVPEETAPPRLVARAPYPNPRVGAGGATFSGKLDKPARVRVELYDVHGRLRASRPFEGVERAGVVAIRWEPEGLSPGTYLVRFVTDARGEGAGQVTTAKWTLLR